MYQRRRSPALVGQIVNRLPICAHGLLARLAERLREALEELLAILDGFVVEPAYRERATRLAAEWTREVDRVCAERNTPLMRQAEVIGIVNKAARTRDVVVCAAGSLPAYQGRSVNLLVSKVPDLPPVTGDRDMLGLAFFNLIDNALKFSASSDAVEVRVREDGRALFIEVADAGAGIALQDQGRIFEDLYRGENARETEGSGLGLALARPPGSARAAARATCSSSSAGRGIS